METSKFRKEQLKLSKEVVVRDDFDKIKYIAGCSTAVVENKIISIVALFEYPSIKFVEYKYSIAKSDIPYIPNYRGYRDMPTITDAFNLLKQKPDMLIVDANGILHPRRIGMASHLGLVLNVPTIGVAKKLLCGKVSDGKILVKEEIRGIELTTKEKANPIYISPGHKVAVGTALKIIKDCMKPPHKMPEPIHFAHKIATKMKKKERE